MRFIKNIFNSEDKKRLIYNFFSLSILQGVNYILPLITLPYLVRVLGIEKFGLIMFAQAFIQYFIIFTDYGFNLSATREISINRNNKEKISEIFCSVMTIRFFLLILSFIIMSIIVFSFDRFRKEWLVYYLTFGIVIGQFLFPVWFFQGMEKMKYITFLNITSKSIFVIAIFLFIHDAHDYIYVPLLYSLGFILAGLISLYIIIKNFQVAFKIYRTKTLIKYFIDSSQFFLSRISVSLYTVSNTFFTGIFLGNTMAGLYSAAEKVYYAIVGIYQPLNDALYPFMSQKKDICLFKKIFFFVFFLSLVLWFFIFIFSDEIIRILYGNDFYISSNLLKIFSLLGIIMVPAILIGYPFVAALGYPKYANFSVVIASVIHIALLIMIIPILNIYIVVVISVISQLFVLIIRIYGVRKHNLWREKCVEL